MADRPTGSDLLHTAREELLEHIMPQAPAVLRYRILMIANAMAIATRELDGGAAVAARERAALGLLLTGSLPSAMHPQDGVEQRRLLCCRIRDGEFDRGTRRAELTDALRALVRDRLSLSNPKLLAAENARRP